eukprot:2215248-Pyramimonas_sp.AAC.1
MRQPPPNTAVRGPARSSTEGSSGTARMRQPPPNTTFRGPPGSSTDGPTGCRTSPSDLHAALACPVRFLSSVRNISSKLMDGHKTRAPRHTSS